MNCGKCGRKLKDPESIRIGYGPTCRAMMGIKSTRIAVKPKAPAPESAKNEDDMPGQMSMLDNPDWLPDTMVVGNSAEQ